ncbi:hypothetical protein DVJ78_00620 [Humibacter sp. BT305]|uniref:ABM domain-containing protein n=1 Tax=Cnuibacter physcomitrellae TaxID=1619308 RepID=A0A1X9LIL6_9MICO|nr:antibiotic biosynthesis monooxygenase [Cnuibacter physcomitrellae]ARJ04138.1 hypothetical protein B5808_02035 [Cnuibacter physcomitrellae]AXH34139.1 hypothetical protein DVJ78_00620 [Humibacter sp. BT305]GGI40346.1 hypothetical protein GCM10010988_28620 [Cnuibacter physcomitrellae]
MIARVWTGQILTSDKAAYRECAESIRVPQTRAVEGNLGVWVLTSDLDAGFTEVLIISHWSTPEALEAWAGYDIDNPVFFEEEAHFFLEGAPTARHFTLAAGRPDPSVLFDPRG